MSSFSEWLQLHTLDVDLVTDCVTVIDSDPLSFELTSVAAPVGPSINDRNLAKDTALAEMISPALSIALGIDASTISDMISNICWTDVQEPGNLFTINHGPLKAPEISLFWQGSVADLVCLAHEVAHAFQIQLSGGEMPPIAREACAFAGELALIKWARDNDPSLADALLQVWQSESQRYLGEDRALVQAGLANPSIPYQYRMNYPLARAAAVELDRAGLVGVQNLFSAGRQAMNALPLEKIASRAARTQNYLPPLDVAEVPATNAYRALGAMALLDIDFWRGESEKRIEDYYSGLLHHLQQKTAFIALDPSRRPMGYATWRRSADEATITLVRQSAPFGDHLALQQALARRLSQYVDVHSLHMRSARTEQTAW
jgi:hypothetical protein